MKCDERAELRGRGLERISLIALEPINGVAQFSSEWSILNRKITVTSKTFRHLICFNRSNVETQKLQIGRCVPAVCLKCFKAI